MRCTEDGASNELGRPLARSDKSSLPEKAVRAFDGNEVTRPILGVVDPHDPVFLRGPRADAVDHRHRYSLFLLRVGDGIGNDLNTASVVVGNAPMWEQVPLHY